MAARNYSSGALPTVLTSPVGSSGNLVVLSLPGTWPAYPYAVLVDWGTTSQEACLVTGPATGAGPYTLPVTRGIDGTPAQSHLAGAEVVHGTTSYEPTLLQTVSADTPSLPVTVGQGGTGATSAPAALTNLGAASASGLTAEISRAETAEALLAPLVSPALTGTPTAPTKTALTNNTDIATTAYTDAAVAAAVAGLASSLTQTAVKTGPYTAAAGQVVPVDTTSASVTITLPNAPAGGALVAVKQVTQGGTNTVTVSRNPSGTDVFNKSGGSTSLTLSLLNQGVLLEYNSGIWMVLSDDLPLGQLDVRYAEKSSATNAVLYLSAASGASDSNDGLSWGSAKATLAGAISALGGNPGSILAGAGTFSFTTVNWPLGTSVIGGGMGVTVFHSTATTGSAFANPSPGTHIVYGGHLEGFNLTGTSPSNATTGLDLESRSHATVRDVLVTDFGTGVSITSATDGFCVYNRFWNVVSTTNTTGWLVGGEGSNSNTFTACQGSGCTAGASVVDSNQNQFYGCQFESNTTGVAITSTGGTGGHSVSNVISGCRFENNGTGWTTDTSSTGNYLTDTYYSGNTANYTDTSGATLQTGDPSQGIIVPPSGYVYAGGVPTVNTGFPLQKGQVSVVSTGASTAVGFTAYEQDGTDNRRIAFWLGGATSWGIGFAFASGTPPPFRLYNGSTSLNPITCNAAQTVFGGGVADLAATQTLASNGAVTINANNGNVQAVTLQANATSSSITNPVTGQELTIQWVQDATGSRTYAWPSSCKFAGGAAPAASTTAAFTDSVTFIYNGTNWQEKCRSAGIH